ncbi:MAG: 30S ribosomal protein S5 [Patescibacteria group bacterium]
MAAPQLNMRRNDDKLDGLDQRVIAIDRVARVVKGGRRFRFRALVAIGDKNGKVGVGSSKGQDVTTAIDKATDVAKRKMRSVCIENSTLPHETNGKVGGAKILLKPAGQGTGMIAGSVPRQILEVAGYTNVVSKSLGNSNKTNLSYAVIEALDALRPTSEWINPPEKKAPAKKASTKAAKPAPKKSTAKKTTPKKKEAKK